MLRYLRTKIHMFSLLRSIAKSLFKIKIERLKKLIKNNNLSISKVF